MRRFKMFLVAALGALSLVGAGSASVLAEGSHRLLEFDSMRPVTGDAVGEVNNRGITGGGLPWAIKSGRGELGRNGEVEVRVKGLVIPVAPFNGTNPVPQFGVIVSCLSKGKVVNTAVVGLSAANTAGDSVIETKVSLPHQCNDPIVFVTAPSGQWFAASRADEEED